VIAIWVLDENILRDKQIHHCFTLMDERSRLQLNDSIEIHTIELEKWRQNQEGAPHEMVRWLRFLTEAEHWSAVPEELKDPVMEEAMGQLEHMQQNTQFNHAYRVRLDGMRRQRTQELALERAEAKERAALDTIERIEAEKQHIEAEKQRIEAEKQRIEAEKQRIEVDKERAEAATKQALLEKAKAEEATRRMMERLRAAGIEPD
jgi:colicin import membrane protein